MDKYANKDKKIPLPSFYKSNPSESEKIKK